MIVFTATLKAKPGKEKELEDALVDMVSEVQNEESTLVYILHRAKNTTGEFTFYEKYRDQAAWEFHDSTTHMKALLKKLELLLADEIKITHFEEITSISR